MSYIDFDNFKARRPDLLPVFDAFERWLNANPDVRYIDVRRVFGRQDARRARSILEAVEVMLDAGVVKQVYRVVDPVRQVLVGDAFDSIRNAPQRVIGPLGEWIDTTEAEIVPLLQEA